MVNLYFNPRAPCGARRFVVSVLLLLTVFQSARPVRGATTAYEKYCDDHAISIRAPRAGRDYKHAILLPAVPAISIRAPRAGRDCRYKASPFRSYYFNPRAPCGARRRRGCYFRPCSCRSLIRLLPPSKGHFRLQAGYTSRYDLPNRPYPEPTRPDGHIHHRPY